MTPALEATGLGKRYGRTWGLRDCSLSLPRGCVAALVGPNGAGKTTLLSLAVGLLRPTAGSVRVLGEDPSTKPGVLARTGFVAQDTPLYADFTADDLLTMGRKLNGLWDEPLARDRLTQLEIPTDRKVGTLSGGQRAQVALAMVLAKWPDLLVLDEPVASLDPLARREFLQVLMASVAEQGITVVLSSHLLADLERLCDHLVVLSASRVQVLGPVDQLLAQHRLLVGPRDDRSELPEAEAIVRRTDTERQTSVLVRARGPIADPRWSVHEVSLEDLVLAYLQDPSAGVLPGPSGASRELRR